MYDVKLIYNFDYYRKADKTGLFYFTRYAEHMIVSFYINAFLCNINKKVKNSNQEQPQPENTVLVK